MNSQTTAALTLGPGGNGSFYDELERKAPVPAGAPEHTQTACPAAINFRQRRRCPESGPAPPGGWPPDRSFPRRVRRPKPPPGRSSGPARTVKTGAPACAGVSASGNASTTWSGSSAASRPWRSEAEPNAPSPSSLAASRAGTRIFSVDGLCCDRKATACAMARLTGSWTPRNRCPSPATSSAIFQIEASERCSGCSGGTLKPFQVAKPQAEIFPASAAASERLDGAAQSLAERLATDLLELGLDVVQVVEVDRLEAEVATAPLDLVFQIAGSHAVASLSDLVFGRDARIEKALGHVASPGPGVFGVVREIASLGRDEDLVARRATLRERARERAADGPLAPLAPVVDRRVENVDPGGERRGDRGFVARVRPGALVAEVGARARSRRERGPWPRGSVPPPRPNASRNVACPRVWLFRRSRSRAGGYHRVYAVPFWMNPRFGQPAPRIAEESAPSQSERIVP